MNSSIEHSAMDLREIDVLRFFFELNQQQMDPVKLQQILLQRHQNLNQSPASSFSPVFKPKVSNISTPAAPTQIPEPKIVFQYVPSPKFPTPTSTPEPKSSSEDEIEDYQKAQRKSKNFQFKDRCHFINLKEEQRLMTPTSSVHESDHSDHELVESNLPKLQLSSKSSTWRGTSIYNNLPDIVMGEYDKILRESHNIKRNVIEKLNQAFPVNYEYNPKKSRIRTNYLDPQVADDRTKNNIASRRSRQRKKFLTHVHQYCVDFDDDENFLLQKQAKWLSAMIGGLENKILSQAPDKDEELYKLRKQCGFN